MKSLLLYAIAVACALLLIVTRRVYKYNDCIKVHHTKTYCILDNGN